jgi:hypothetical protein
MVFHYTAGHGKQGILTLVPSTSNSYVAVATVNGNSMVVSNPRPLDEAIEWARGWCGNFCIV